MSRALVNLRRNVIWPTRFRQYSKSSQKRGKKDKPAEETEGKDDITTETGRTFQQMGVSYDRLNILEKRNLITMFPIQEKTYRTIREGKDVIGRAKTGTGKTLAYLLPLVERYESQGLGKPKSPFILVLAPTRELVLQVNKEACAIAPKLRVISVYGGHPVTSQAKHLSKHVDIVVGTPGRVLHFLNDRTIELHNIKAFVLDEADHMLDTGFKQDLEVILSMLPRTQQTLLFSATLPQWVKEMAQRFFKNPEIVDLVSSLARVTPSQVTHKYISITLSLQRIIVLSRLIARYRNEKMLVFVHTKADCAQLAASPLISFTGRVRALHGDIKQEERASVLQGFRSGVHNVVIATDVAARGLDITNIDLVVHYQVPKATDSYIHRSGRCGRAGKMGTVISIISGKDKFLLDQIQKRVGFEIEEIPVPNEEDVAKIACDGIKDTLHRVEFNTAKYYLPLAQSLLKEGGEILFAKALSALAGHHQQSFSLLNGTEGFTTLRVSSTKESVDKLSAVSFLHKLGGKKFGLAQICPDGTTVIDCQTDQVATILSNLTNLRNKTASVEIVKDLPEITPTDQVLSFRQGAIAMDEKYSTLKNKPKVKTSTLPDTLIKE